MRHASKAIRLFAAFLVLLGTSGSAFSTLCGGGTANAPCPMKAALKAEVKPQSCCPEKAAKEEKKDDGGCCCKLTADTDSPANTAKASIPSIPIPIALVPAPISLVEPTCSANAELISFFADRSPPIVSAGLNTSRAPPLA